jgi:hypothetical protein
MTRSSAPLPGRPLPGLWNYGAHPGAKGLEVRSLGRVELQLGDALRLEMGSTGPVAVDVVCVQYFIAMAEGGWALWLSCRPSELADNEAALRAMPVVAARS